MGSVADKLFLLLEQVFIAFGLTDSGFIEFFKFGNLRVILQDGVVAANGVTIQPFQKGVKGAHAPVENP